MEATIKYVEAKSEINQESLFTEINRWIKKAKSEILVLSEANELKEDFARFGENRKTHENYLKALEDKVQEHKNKKFIYTRIQQISKEDEDSSTINHFGPDTINHCKEILKIAEKDVSPDLLIHIMKITTQRTTSFIIIDRRYLIFSLGGVNDRKLKYIVGAFFIEDRDGDIIDSFIRYFRKVEHEATNLSLSDFNENIQQTQNGMGLTEIGKDMIGAFLPDEGHEDLRTNLEKKKEKRCI